MFRRFVSARCLLRLASVLALVLVPVGAGLAPTPVGAGEADDVQGALQLQRMPARLDGAEVVQPGDDDQPTVIGGKRVNRLASAPAPVGPSTSPRAVAAPPAEDRFGVRMHQAVRSFLLVRFGVMLR